MTARGRAGAVTAPSVRAGSPREAAERELVRLDRVAVRRDGREVWTDVTLTVRAGEFVAVLGANGAGKSTLLEAILGLLPTAAGSLVVLGGRAGSHNDRIGYLPQRRAIERATRIRGVDVVRLGLDGGRWGVPLPGSRLRKEGARRVQEVVELVGASAYAERPIGELSGGERQRLFIAQALIARPQLLLLDEPLDSLDLQNQSLIAALAQRLCRAEGIAVMLVAHDVNPILDYLDQVVYFAGSTALCGAPGDVISAATLTRLHGTPIEVLQTSDGRLVVVGQPEAPHVHSDRHGH